MKLPLTWQHEGKISGKLDLTGTVIFKGVQASKIKNLGTLSFAGGVNTFQSFISEKDVAFEGDWIFGLAKPNGIAFVRQNQCEPYDYRTSIYYGWTKFKTDIFNTTSTFNITGNAIYQIPYSPIPMNVKKDVFFPEMPGCAFRTLDDLIHIKAKKAHFVTSEKSISGKHSILGIEELFLFTTGDLTVAQAHLNFNKLVLITPVLTMGDSSIEAKAITTKTSFRTEVTDSKMISSGDQVVASAGPVQLTNTDVVSTAASTKVFASDLDLQHSRIKAKKNNDVESTGNISLEHCSLDAETGDAKSKAGGSIADCASQHRAPEGSIIANAVGPIIDSRIRERHLCLSLSSELSVQLSPHSAQAFIKRLDAAQS